MKINDGKFVGSPELYSLIDRLQKCSEVNYPNRPWHRDFYYECAYQWKDKINELEERVLELESKINNNGE